jgi:ribosomal protein S18 acetylase RimI-like enzyme
MNYFDDKKPLDFNPLFVKYSSDDPDQEKWSSYIRKIQKKADLQFSFNWEIQLENPAFHSNSLYFILNNDEPIGSICGQIIVPQSPNQPYGNISYFYLNKAYHNTTLSLKMIRFVLEDLFDNGIKTVYCSLNELNDWKHSALIAQGFTTVDSEVFLKHPLENIPKRDSDSPYSITAVRNDDELKEAIILHNSCFVDTNYPMLTFEEMKYLIENDPSFSLKQFLVARTKRNLIGCVHYFVHKEIGWISSVGVKSRYRNRPIFNELLKDVLRRLQRNGTRFANTCVIESSSAHRNYEKMDFVIFQRNLVMKHQNTKK